MNAKRFFHIAAGILMLVIAYSFGSSRVRAQSGGEFTFTGITVNYSNEGATVAITSAGDVYARAAYTAAAFGDPCHLMWHELCSAPYPGWTYMGNVLGGTIQTEGKSWSAVKGAYRK